MASAELSRRVEKIVGYPPLSEMGDLQGASSTRRCSRRTGSRICPGKWQAAVVSAEQNRPGLRVVSGD
jgi:hypothetical protein